MKLGSTRSIAAANVSGIPYPAKGFSPGPGPSTHPTE